MFENYRGSQVKLKKKKVKVPKYKRALSKLKIAPFPVSPASVLFIKRGVCSPEHQRQKPVLLLCPLCSTRNNATQHSYDSHTHFSCLGEEFFLKLQLYGVPFSLDFGNFAPNLQLFLWRTRWPLWKGKLLTSSSPAQDRTGGLRTFKGNGNIPWSLSASLEARRVGPATASLLSSKRVCVRILQTFFCAACCEYVQFIFPGQVHTGFV